MNILPFVARPNSDCVAHIVISHFSETCRRDQRTAIDTVVDVLETFDRESRRTRAPQMVGTK